MVCLLSSSSSVYLNSFIATVITLKRTEFLGLLVDGFPDDAICALVDDVHDFIFLHFQEMK